MIIDITINLLCLMETWLCENGDESIIGIIIQLQQSILFISFLHKE